MNKKFLSAILFGALMVTSTGTFVSCKDYDDDINDLQEQINAQNSGLTAQITALQTALAAAQADATAAKTAADAAKQAAADAKASAIEEALAAIEAAKGATDEELADIAAKIAAIDTQLVKLGDYDAQVAAINTLKIQVEALQNYKDLLAEKADVEAIEATIATIQKAMETIATSDSVAALDKKVEEIAVQVAKLSEDLVTIEAKSLRALVFVPSLYLDGVEAFRYPYAPGYYLNVDAEETEGEVKAYLDQPAVNFTIPATSKWQYETSRSAYTLTPIQTLYYHLNPSHVSIDGIAFDFISNDAEFVTTRAAGAAWSADFVKAAKVGGELAVDYKISNPQAVKWAGEDEENSIVSLNATLEEGKTISSDYASVLPAVQTLKAIAFVDKTTPAVDCVLGDELYLTGKVAAEEAPSIAVAYNKGGINLDELLNIHYTQKDFVAPDASADHKVMDYKVAKENYGLKFEYEMMPYFVGANETNESMYGKVVDNMFYPCYVKTGATPTQVVCGSNNEGISAVGKMPIVQVRLVDAAGKVVLNGYIKLHIVKEIGYTDIVIRSFELPLICGDQAAKITWDEASDKIYEKLGKSKEEFHNEFVPVDNAYPWVKTEDTKNPFKQLTSVNMGVMESDIDGDGAGTTNAWVSWSGNLDALKNIANKSNREYTLYYKFASRTDETYFVYIGVTIKVAEAPEATFGEKIAAYWYADITGKAQENVRNNVPRPTTAGIANKDVKSYVKDLNDNFKGNAIKVSLTAASQNQLYIDGEYSADVDYEFTTNHIYQFAADQPKIGDYQLARGTTNYGELWAGNALIATITPQGVVTYNNNSIKAKEILNLFGHNETTAAKMQYANVEVVATYGECEEPLADTTFPVRFLRPVDIHEGPNATFEDAQANGSAVVLGDFIKLEDWRDMNLLAKEGDLYVSNIENGCALFDYYLFETIKIDIDNAASTLTGTKELLKDVTDKLKLTVDNNGTETEGTTTVSFNNVNALNTTKIVYYNNAGNVQEFDLYIPIEITYSWGTLKGEIVAKVAKTKAN